MLEAKSTLFCDTVCFYGTVTVSICSQKLLKRISKHALTKNHNSH